MPDPTGGWLVVKHPQYVEETTYGVAPTNPAWLWTGVVEAFDPQPDMATILARQLASEDIRYQMKGPETHTLLIEYIPQNVTLAKYGVNAAGGGVGTIDKSLYILTSVKVGGQAGTETYVEHAGCRFNNIVLTGRVGEFIRIRGEIWPKDIPIPDATPPALGTGSYATDPGTNPWKWDDGGANPVSFGARNPDVREISASVSRNLDRLLVMGQVDPKYTLPKQRDITGTLRILWEDQNLWTDMDGQTVSSLTWVLKTAAGTLTLANTVLRRIESVRMTQTEFIMEQYAYVSRSASLA